MKICFMGRKKVGRLALEWLLDGEHEVVAVLTDDHLAVSPTRDLAREAGIPIYRYESAREALRVGDLTYDVGVSMLYWRILREEFLAHPPRGTINFHPAPLPDFRGTAGYNVAVLRGLREWAVSAHFIDPGIDTGPIIRTRRFAIDVQAETAQSLERKSQIELLELFRGVMQDVFDGKPLSTEPNVGGQYISRDEMEAMKVVRDGDDIDRKIRAFWFPPYDGAVVELGGKRYTLVNREILESLADGQASSLFTRKVC
jgi:methionyl-tRNA formyltransferase